MSRFSRVSLPQALVTATVSVFRFSSLLIGGRIHQPRRHVGHRLDFATGASARVFRETVVDQQSSGAPSVVVFEYRLRATHDWVQTLYLPASVLITPFLAGLEGFVSKMWLEFDDTATYGGIYQWDGAQRAESSAQVLRWILPLIASPDSITYHVIPDTTRDRYLTESQEVAEAVPPASGD